MINAKIVAALVAENAFLRTEIAKLKLNVRRAEALARDMDEEMAGALFKYFSLLKETEVSVAKTEARKQKRRRK